MGKCIHTYTLHGVLYSQTGEARMLILTWVARVSTCSSVQQYLPSDSATSCGHTSCNDNRQQSHSAQRREACERICTICTTVVAAMKGQHVPMSLMVHQEPAIMMNRM